MTKHLAAWGSRSSPTLITVFRIISDTSRAQLGDGYPSPLLMFVIDAGRAFWRLRRCSGCNQGL